MHFGICTAATRAADVKAAGWEFVEDSVQRALVGLSSDAEWQPAADSVRHAPLPTPAANVFVPGTLKITGPTADLAALTKYVQTVLARAAKLGIHTIVFGSGGARNVPDGFSRDQAVQQITAFARMAAQTAAPHKITIVVEPLNRAECNIINSIAEAMTYVNAINHPNLECLLDTYHFWVEDEPLENLKANMPHIKHVHLADKDGRVAPGLSGTADYRPVFRILKQANYQGLISVEALNFTIPTSGKQVLDFVKKQWSEA